jgi:hypothetical protein
LPKITFLVFLTLWITFALLGYGAITANPGLSHAGGWLGLICGTLALYAGFGIVTNATFGRPVVPLGLTPVLRN